MTPAENELRWLRRVRDLCQRLASERRPEELLTLILDTAIELTEAERGYLVEVRPRPEAEGYAVKIRCARGFDQRALRGAAGDVSRTVVARALEEQRGIVTSDERDCDVLEVSSVQSRKVRAIACVPMFLRGEPRGVLYLDHRFREDPFTEADLPHLQTFADQGALALETAGLLADLSQARDDLGASLNELQRFQAAQAPAPPAGIVRREFGALVGGSAPMLAVFEEVERAARTWDPVLIVGESGTGKTLVAREIHRRGALAALPFLPVSVGRLDLEARASIYIPEVADLTAEEQRRLVDRLRRPAGGEWRLLAGTRHEPSELLAGGLVREDLLYRLDVFRIALPPLRQRVEDLLMLIEHFAERAGVVLRFTTHTQDVLRAYTWPGNLRQLENEVRRLVPHAPGPISAPQLSPELVEGRGVARASGQAAGKTIAQVEADMVEAALKACKGNKSRAARQLGIPRTTLYSLIQRHGL